MISSMCTSVYAHVTVLYKSYHSSQSDRYGFDINLIGSHGSVYVLDNGRIVSRYVYALLGRASPFVSTYSCLGCSGTKYASILEKP
jgi:hypothetical protein